ncbi:YjjG family noncanonical pyrimidine nucleotidase [Flavobacterium orientale]|uniref:Noncanonical pyrimidine nucleotidase, YjjG family protein n=1 Tax=Flavobacterium orientale TaxID=1756020 RepID=A0A916Y5J0_9FLAO|nr:YjjG family noncanonical pyrimidine nucleotidase [Flavobacterium orientale]GGD31969.1 noncanonical pyrimidine nucleotidase, YjjG family protein [Flavobacterium orientale]
MKPFQNKSDIFFDLDHTLWDFEKNSALAFEVIFDKHKLDLDLSLFLNFYVPTNLKYWKLYRDEKISQEDLRYFRLKEVFDLMKEEVHDDIIHLIAKEYIVYLPQFNNLYQGALEILEYLHPKYKLHIITNGFHSVQEGKLKNSNIKQYFTTVTNSELAGVKKPNPLIFDYALKSAKAQRATSIMIGDSLEADVEGAINSGLDAIFFNEFNIEVTPSITQINHLLLLKNYL